MGIGTPFEESYPKTFSETPNCHRNLEMIDLEKNPQEINPMGLSDPLTDYYRNNYSGTPNYHQKFEMISLENL